MLQAGEAPQLRLLPQSVLQEVSAAEPRHQLHQAGRDWQLDLRAVRHQPPPGHQGGPLAVGRGGETETAGPWQGVLAQDISTSGEVTKTSPGQDVGERSVSRSKDSCRSERRRSDGGTPRTRDPWSGAGDQTRPGTCEGRSQTGHSQAENTSPGQNVGTVQCLHCQSSPACAEVRDGLHHLTAPEVLRPLHPAGVGVGLQRGGRLQSARGRISQSSDRHISGNVQYSTVQSFRDW